MFQALRGSPALFVSRSKARPQAIWRLFLFPPTAASVLAAARSCFDDRSGSMCESEISLKTVEKFRLHGYVVAQSYENRICMEEVYAREGVTYMDIYVPVDTQ